MADVTVVGANGETIKLKFTSSANAELAQRGANNITNGVKNHSIVPFEYAGNPFIPSAPLGKTGEFVQEKDGVAILPFDYNAVVINTKYATVFGGAAPNETVLSGSGNFTFFTGSGSGFIGSGGGNNLISVSGGGNWQIDTGDGFDMILALSGNNAITARPGRLALFVRSASR